jgi:hypothetical protein
MRRPSPEDIEALSQADDHVRALEAIDLQSVLVVPLLAHGKLLGTVTLMSVTPSRVYEPDDMRVAQELAHRAALAIENARLYRTAQRAIQMRDEVLRIVAHDLRSPLSVIVIEAGLLRRRGPEPERRSTMSAEAIKSAAARMNRMIQDFLDVARMEAGRLHVERCRTQAVQIASNAVESQRPRGFRRVPQPSARSGAGPSGCLGRPRSTPPGVREPDRQRPQVHGVGRAHHCRSGSAQGGSTLLGGRHRIPASLSTINRTCSISSGRRTRIGATESGWVSRSSRGLSRPTAAASGSRAHWDAGAPSSSRFRQRREAKPSDPSQRCTVCSASRRSSRRVTSWFAWGTSRTSPRRHRR